MNAYVSKTGCVLLLTRVFDFWIRSALELVSAASGGLVDYSIEPAHYDVRGADVMRLADLAAATADPHANLFEAYYQSSVLAELERDRPDLVAVSILNVQQVIPGLTLARRLKTAGHFVVIGGTVYTKFVGELLQRPEFFRLFCDGLIAYEGETALLELVEQLAGGRDLSRVPNLLYLDRSGRVTFTRYHVEDVSALPTPDFDGLPLDDYLAPAPVLPILTGKGCYFNRCKFCDIPFINHISKKAYRVRTPERVAEDVARLHERYGTRCWNRASLPRCVGACTRWACASCSSASSPARRPRWTTWIKASGWTMPR